MSLPNNNDAALPTAVPLTKQKGRGPGYTVNEDLIVCRAFIAASENPIVGNNRKAKDFESALFHIYKELTADHMHKDQQLINASSVSTCQEYLKEGIGIKFPERESKHILSRFHKISRDVMKFMGIQETTDIASGENDEIHKRKCLAKFANQHGRPFDFWACLEYLQDKNKFSTYRTKCEYEAKGSRPIGKKKTRQMEADEKLIKSVVSEITMVNPVPTTKLDVENTAIGKMLEKVSVAVVDFGEMLTTNMNAEQEMRLMNALPTPERLQYVRNQLVELNTERAKRRRLRTPTPPPDIVTTAFGYQSVESSESNIGGSTLDEEVNSSAS